MSTIRGRWTTLVLHTTSYVYNQKQKLLTAHAGKAFFIVIGIICAEVFLGLISLPLYLIVKPAGVGDGQGSEYRVRRVITLSVLTAIFLVWILKLIFILVLSLYFDTRAMYSVKETSVKNDLSSGMTTDIALAPVNRALSVPKIISVEQNTGSAVTAEGTSDRGAIVGIYFTRTDDVPGTDGSLHIYANTADTKGHWTHTEDENVFTLPPGRYVAAAVQYDQEKNQKSALSAGVDFSVHESLLQQFFRRLDTILNIVVLLFICVGVVSIVLML